MVKHLPYCKLTFFDKYVIAEPTENLVHDASTVNEILKVIHQHFDGKEFVIISHRRNKYTLTEDAYTPRLWRKVRGLAVVSESPIVKEKAISEQSKFNNSFVFFEKLEEAQNWASNLFV